jgi:hypothetical protein
MLENIKSKLKDECIISELTSVENSEATTPYVVRTISL